MECNKEEALRAKDIAERKMQEKDFVAARKFALKAQQLYPEAENISQMICVCDVHCAADRKIFGKELDWYAILQIEQSADDALIKKHYRKYALLLHPDKNKFAGAESAFKLIGDAQRALLDRDKRSLFDMRYRTTPYTPVMPQQGSRSVHVPRQYRAQSNSRSPFSNVKDFNPSYQVPKQPGHPGAANGKETFWTLCPFCLIRYQYYKDVVDRKINCQSCKNAFIAKELQEQSGSRGSNSTHPVFPQNVPHASGSNVGSGTTDAKPGFDPRFWRGQNVEFTRSSSARQPRNWGDDVNKDGGDMGSKSSRKGSSRRGKRQEVESSESFDTDSSINTDEVEIDVDSLRAQRRSTRNKRHVSYNENGSDDDDEAMSYSKKAKENGSSSPLVEDHIGAKGGYSEVDGVDDTVFQSMNENYEADDGFMFDSGVEPTPDPTVYECPDPEFYDFDKEREEHCFKVGQLWAVYDTIDAMPRFYARIRKVSSPGFKLRITWLEPDPYDVDGREWARFKLPFSCGKFKSGSSENTEDRLMFSHQVVLDNGVGIGGRGTIMIYPIKGETWAIFKNWDSKWYLLPENERKLEYEFVEILCEYDAIEGTRVAILGKLKGFASLFCRKDGSELRIPPSEILRFSHRVPSYRMTGLERNNIPIGSYELDPASLTMNLEEISLPKQYFEPCTTEFSSNFDAVDSDDVIMDEKPAPSDAINDFNHRDILNSTFFDFGGMKLLDKFQVNQVWALYSDVDGLPRCYGFIKQIDLFPIFTLHLSFLEACYLPNDSTLWKDKKMPISCGQFKAKSSKRRLYTCNSSFSHQLQVDQKGQKVYSIYPQKGHVWALYKNWHPDIAFTELGKCEYDIVVVLEDDLLCFKVLALEHVDGFNSVFRPQKRGTVNVTWDIPHSEILRFSHQIPSFRLQDEKYGTLQGYWDLDRAAIPVHLLHKSK